MDYAVLNIEAQDRDWPALMPRLIEGFPELARVWDAVDALRLEDVAQAQEAAAEAENRAKRAEDVLCDAADQIARLSDLAGILAAMTRPEPGDVAALAKEIDSLGAWIEAMKRG